MIKKIKFCFFLVLVFTFFILTPGFSQGLKDLFGGSKEDEESDTKEKSDKSDDAQQPIIVNGDKVEYSTENKEFVAEGNVLVVYKDSKLTCQKLSLNSVTKECTAEGGLRLEETQGIIEGQKMQYNFETKKGVIFDTNFRAQPFFGHSEKLSKLSAQEFISRMGYITSCDYKDPHWRMKSKKVNFFPGDKVQLKDATFFISKIPIMNLPQYNHSFKDPIMHVQLMPGTSKEWGAYMLSAWRYNLTEDIKGRIYFDVRQKAGVAEGFATNYDSKEFGKGDFKLYYTNEKDTSDDIDQTDENRSNEFERYLIRLRHKWDIDDRTNLVAEYYRIVDSKRANRGTEFNFLKDYFPREYEKAAQPLSYLYLHHAFSYSSLDFQLQKRTNNWYTQEEKLPEIRYSLPSISILGTPFYIENNSSFTSIKQKGAAPSTNDDRAANTVSTSNKISLPSKVSFLYFTPNVGASQGYSDRGIFSSTMQNSFFGGADVSTKFYRIFNFKTNFLNLNINDIRHIITPTFSYSYSNTSDFKMGTFKVGGNGSSRSSSAAFGLENTFQTKRDNLKVKLLNVRVESNYTFKSAGLGGQLADISSKFEFYPYSWMSLVGDATYKVKDAMYFSGVNYDLNFNLGTDRTFGLGQRYQYQGSNEYVYQLNWRMNPKWRLSFYHRLNLGSGTAIKRGLREQEYSITRDLHCWSASLNYNISPGKGDTIWLVFRIKAFPEMEFEINKSYNAPKPGSQTQY